LQIEHSKTLDHRMFPTSRHNFITTVLGSLGSLIMTSLVVSLQLQREYMPSGTPMCERYFAGALLFLLAETHYTYVT
jgi:hypothetical protein